MLFDRLKLKVGIAVAFAFAITALLAPGAASAKSLPGQCGGGGISAAETDICTPTAKARLLANGMLIPPASAPPRVKGVIAAANAIRSKPYIYGGGHGRWYDRGYDCSGSVSFALHGGKFLTTPLDSSSFESWEEEGEGRWITVWTNPGHAYAVIAGYRFDTSGDEGGETGPRWHAELRDNIGFLARHPVGY